MLHAQYTTPCANIHAQRPQTLVGCRIQHVSSLHRQQQQRMRLHFSTGRLSPVPQHLQAPGRRIVLAIDTDAEGSYKALQYTLQHIYQRGDVLHLLHVVPASTGLVAQGQCLAFSMPPEEGLQEQMTARAQQYFEQHYMTLAEQQGATVELDLVRGSCKQPVADAICQKVEALAAELVVLPVQRKRSLFEELFQVPFSQQLAQVCPCPTLIVHDAH